MGTVLQRFLITIPAVKNIDGTERWDWSAVGRWPVPDPVPTPELPDSSPDGTTIPPADQIVDAQGRVWKVADGKATRDGAILGLDADVLTLWLSHIFARSASGDWWQLDPADKWRPYGRLSPLDPDAPPILKSDEATTDGATTPKLE